MKETNSSKKPRSHHRAKQQGLTRVGVHESVLEAAQGAVNRVQEVTGKRLRPGELLDWLAEAEETLVIIGTYIAQHRPYEVSIDAYATQAAPFVRVVNGWKHASNVPPVAVPEPPTAVKKSRKQKKEDMPEAESLPGFESCK